MTRSVSAMLLAACFAGPATAQDEPLLKVPGPFRAYCVVDNRFDPEEDERDREGIIHCSASEHGVKPFVAVFSRRLPTDEQDPLFKLLAKLEEPAETYKLQRTGIFATFMLLGDVYQHVIFREKTVELVNQLGGALKPKRLVLGLSEHSVIARDQEGAVVGPATPSKKLQKWQIEAADEVTVIFSHKYHIKGRWVFTAAKPLTEADITEILKAIDTELEPLTKRN